MSAVFSPILPSVKTGKTTKRSRGVIRDENVFAGLVERDVTGILAERKALDSVALVFRFSRPARNEVTLLDFPLSFTA